MIIQKIQKKQYKTNKISQYRSKIKSKTIKLKMMRMMIFLQLHKVIRIKNNKIFKMIKKIINATFC